MHHKTVRFLATTALLAAFWIPGGVGLASAQASGLKPAPHPVTGTASSEAKYICSLQNPDGSIRQISNSVPGSSAYTPINKISPYFANYAVMGLAREAKTNASEAACGWAELQWYASAELANAGNTTGVVYDYVTDPTTGNAKPLYTYDSADSYAATFLMATRDMYAVTGHFPTLTDPLKRTWTTQIEAPANLLHRLLLASGTGNGAGYFDLTEVAPDNQHGVGAPTIAYGMDNVEALNGLKAAAELATILHDTTLLNQANSDMALLKQGLQNHMWNASLHGYNLYTDPATGAVSPVNYAGEFYYGGSMTNLFAVALGATNSAPEGAAARNSAIINTFYNGAAHSTAPATCWSGLPTWEQNIICSGSALPIQGIAAADTTDAVLAYKNELCAFNVTTSTTHAPAAGCPANTPQLAELAISGVPGELMMAKSALYDGTSWQTVQLQETP